jgi:hypothetical protein
LSETIVVSCRGSRADALPRPDAGYLDRARALVRLAEALGGSFTAWSAETLGFSWGVADVEKAVTFATRAAREERNGRHAWSTGIAEGSLEELGHGKLAWGTPLVDAVALARVADAGEVLVDGGVACLQSGELLIVGKRISLDAGRRVRGARLDVRQPWKRESAAQIARLVDPPLVGRESELALLSSSPGKVTILRADPGLGGSRLLGELFDGTAPSKALLLTPSAEKAEPLGAVRRAFTHLAGSEPLKLDEELHGPLDRLLAGEGTTLAEAKDLIQAYLTMPPHVAGAAPPALLIDDAIEIDTASLEASLRAAAESPVPWLIVVRVDALADVPTIFEALPRGKEVELRPLVASDAGRIAERATGNALSPAGAARWARRGGFTPLGVVEAITSGLATGELAWVGDAARGRRMASGKGTPRPASFWIAQRAEELSPEARAVLVAIALLGGSAPLTTIVSVVGKLSSSIDVDAELPGLLKARWLFRLEDGWFALPTRSHRAAVLQLMNDARSRAWHRAIGEALELAGGALRFAEAAQHAARAGDGPWAARLASLAAKRATELGHDTPAMRLVAFARAQDPSMSDEASTSLPPPSSLRAGVGLSIPPGPLSIPPPPSMVPVSSATTRMRAMQDLSRGNATQAVRTLRSELEKLHDAGAVERSKAALALGLALAHAGEAEQALLAALEGLARSREGGDVRGEKACMMLVAQLLVPSGTDARQVREAASAKG